MNKEPEAIEERDYEPIPDNIELSQDAQKMFDEMDATFDDESLIDRVKPAK